MNSKIGHRLAGLKTFVTTVLVWLMCAACNTSPAGPSTTAPTIACPQAQTALSPAGGAVTVDYPKPTIVGGTAPVTLSCTPPAGSPFAVGSTSVACTARDGDQRTVSCSFKVNVSKTPQVRATTFLAFGDSITAGVLATSCPIGGGVRCSASTATATLAQPLYDPQHWFTNLGEESAAAYPRALQTMLSNRYAAQSFAMINEGSPGEFVSRGKDRLIDVLTRSMPQVLLLQEGTVDLSRGHPPIAAVVEGLRSMVRSARNREIVVFIGTLLPQRPNACRGYDFCDGTNDIVPANAQIRAMAASEGAILVDLYQAFDGQASIFLGFDGLHPNEAGYAKMAEMFFDAIRTNLETP